MRTTGSGSGGILIGGLRQGKVLVVEDDGQVLESLQILLSVWGYNVILSQTPEPEALITEHPDMGFIISDYQLNAGQDGIAIIQQLRELAGWDIPALLITGNTSPILAKKLEKLSIPVSYKPINPALLKKQESWTYSSIQSSPNNSKTISRTLIASTPCAIG